MIVAMFGQVWVRKATESREMALVPQLPSAFRGAITNWF
jgi:hypothetical protein